MNKNTTYQHFEILVKQNLKVHILLYLAVSHFSVCFVDGGFEGDVQNTAWFAAFVAEDSNQTQPVHVM